MYALCRLWYHTVMSKCKRNQWSYQIMSCIKWRPQNSKTHCSGLVVLRLSCLPRHGRAQEKEAAAASHRIQDHKGGKDCPRVAAHRLRPFIMCVFYYPDSWHPPDPSGISLFISNLQPVISLRNDSMDHYHRMKHMYVLICWINVIQWDKTIISEGWILMKFLLCC